MARYRIAYGTVPVGQFSLPETGPDFAGLARLKAAEPLKPKVPQAACDHGLFSDEASQLDLVTIARKQEGK